MYVIKCHVDPLLCVKYFAKPSVHIKSVAKKTKKPSLILKLNNSRILFYCWFPANQAKELSSNTVYGFVSTLPSITILMKCNSFKKINQPV